GSPSLARPGRAAARKTLLTITRCRSAFIATTSLLLRSIEPEDQPARANREVFAPAPNGIAHSKDTREVTLQAGVGTEKEPGKAWLHRAGSRSVVSALCTAWYWDQCRVVVDRGQEITGRWPGHSPLLVQCFPGPASPDPRTKPIAMPDSTPLRSQN